MSAPASVLSRPSAGVLWSAALGLLLIVAISLFGLGLRGTAELDRMVDRDLEALVIAHEEGGPERAQGLIEELQANRFALLPDFSGRIATLAEAGSLGLDARVSERGTAELSGERSRARAVLVTEGRAIVAARSLAPLRSELIQLALVLLAAAGAAMALAWTLVERSRRKLARRVDALAGAMRDTVRLGGAPDLPASDANDELDYVARTAGDAAAVAR